jgi:hypothetical protein
MKYFLFFSLLVLFSCKANHSKQIDLFFYTSYITKNNNFNRDTFEMDQLKFHKPTDSLGAKFSFELEGKKHEIRMFSSSFKGGCGGSIFYELDQLGIIYSKKSFSNFYKRLRSTNDSINNLIDVALENIIAIPELHDESVFAPPMEETVEFK